MTRKRGWMPLREERLRPAERSSRRGARMKTAGRIDATAIVCSVDIALLRRIASTLLEGEINTVRRAKPLPPALEAPIRAGRPARRRSPHAHRRIVWRAGALFEEGGSAAGAP